MLKAYNNNFKIKGSNIKKIHFLAKSKQTHSDKTKQTQNIHSDKTCKVQR